MYSIRPQYSIPAGKGEQENVTVHWIIKLCEIAAAISTMGLEKDACEKPEIMRVKQINLAGRAGYMIKLQHTRSRVMLYAVDKEITAVFSHLAPIDATKPHSPQYVIDKEEKCTFLNYHTMTEMARSILTYLTTDTPYSHPDGFTTISVTTKFYGAYVTPTFWYGEIISVTNDGDTVVLEVRNPNEARDVRVNRSAIRFDEIKPGYYLVYASETEADVVGAADLRAYYYDVDRDEVDGEPHTRLDNDN